MRTTTLLTCVSLEKFRALTGALAGALSFLVGHSTVRKEGRE